MKKISCYATKEELSDFCEKNNLNLTEVKHAQVCFLCSFTDKQRKEIAAITGYCASTISSLKSKVKDLIAKAKRWFIDTTKSFFSDVEISYSKGCGEDTKTPCVYLFKFYDEDGEIIFSKVGTTKRGCLIRLKEEIANYFKTGYNIFSVRIEKIFQCMKYPAEAYECFLKSKFIKKYPNTWIKNDRFLKTDIDTNLFLSYCLEYEG